MTVASPTATSPGRDATSDSAMSCLRPDRSHPTTERREPPLDQSEIRDVMPKKTERRRHVGYRRVGNMPGCKGLIMTETTLYGICREEGSRPPQAWAWAQAPARDPKAHASTAAAEPAWSLDFLSDPFRVASLPHGKQHEPQLLGCNNIQDICTPSLARSILAFLYSGRPVTSSPSHDGRGKSCPGCESSASASTTPDSNPS